MADPLSKVRPGQPLRIPAVAYNAFVDAAKVARGVAQNTARDASREQTRALTPIRNDTLVTIPRFGVLGVGGPLFDPIESPDGFARRLALIGSTPSETLHLGKFVIAVEPIAPGAIGMACASGLCVVQIEFPADAGERGFADIADGVATHLVASVSGSSRILWHEPIPMLGGVVWAIIRLGDSGHDELLAVTLTQVGGEQGTDVTPATWTYDVTDPRTPDAGPLALAIDPIAAPSVWARPATGQVEKATAGLAYVTDSGALALAWINEVFAGGGSGDFQAVFVAAARLNNVVTPAPVVGPAIQISYDLATTPGGPAVFVNVSPSGDRPQRHIVAAVVGAVGAAKITLNELQEPIISALILPEDDPQKVLIANDDEPPWPVAAPWVGNAGAVFNDPLRLEKINNVDGTVTIKLITNEPLVALKRLKPGDTGADQTPADPFTDKVILAAARSTDEVERSSVIIAPGGNVTVDETTVDLGSFVAFEALSVQTDPVTEEKSLKVLGRNLTIRASLIKIGDEISLVGQSPVLGTVGEVQSLPLEDITGQLGT